MGKLRKGRFKSESLETVAASAERLWLSAGKCATVHALKDDKKSARSGDGDGMGEIAFVRLRMLRHGLCGIGRGADPAQCSGRRNCEP
jgi:hypothetical protein